MKKYVYMIDYEDKSGSDQIECYDIKDLMTQLKYLKAEENINETKVMNVKLVEDENRWNEEDISYTLAQNVIRLLGYKPEYMTNRRKKQGLPKN